MSTRIFVIGGLCVLSLAAIGIVILTSVFGDFVVADEKKDNVYVEDKDEKVITTKSGLKYVEQLEGKGAEAKLGSTVLVHYTGTLTNGKKFDSSRDRGQPYEVTIGKSSVIKGWHEGLQGMKVGGKRKLIIPSDLAYGDDGKPPVIPQKATLIFELELVEIK